MWDLVKFLVSGFVSGMEWELFKHPRTVSHVTQENRFRIQENKNKYLTLFIKKPFDFVAKKGQRLRDRPSGRGFSAKLSSRVFFEIFQKVVLWSYPLVPLS